MKRVLIAQNKEEYLRSILKTGRRGEEAVFMERKVRNMVEVWNSTLERVRHAILRKNVTRSSRAYLKRGLVPLQEVKELFGGRVGSIEKWLEDVERRVMVLQSILRRIRKCVE